MIGLKNQRDLRCLGLMLIYPTVITCHWISGPNLLNRGASRKQIPISNAVADKVHLRDMHATILHLLGLNHEKLTYRYAGRDFRLTDVSGSVVREILA